MPTSTSLKRGPRYRSRRYETRTGDPMPAYVIDGFVVEKARRDWDHRVAGQNARSWAGPKEWWEVRRQGARTQPGVAIGEHPLYQGDTLRECIDWIEARVSDAANDHVREARDALRNVQTGRIWFGEAAECLNPIIDAIKALDRLAGLDNVARAKHVDEGPCGACTSQTPRLSDVLTAQGFPPPQVARVKDGTPCDVKNCPEPAVGFLSIRGVLWAVCRPHAEQKASEADA